MKAVLIVLVLLTGSRAVAETPTLFGVNLIAARKCIMYFKFDRELEGAEVQVYDQRGRSIAHHTLHKHKLIIDFIDADPGNYTVIVTKGNRFKAFHYTQVDTRAVPAPLPLSASASEPHANIIFY